MNYKLLAVDIDGTLLNSQGKLTDQTQKRIQEARERGVLFVLSTGRPIQGVKSLVDQIGGDFPLITYNGAMVLRGKSQEVLYSSSLRNEDLLEAYQAGEKRQATMLIWSDNKLYANKDNQKSRHYSSLTNTPFKVIETIDELNRPATKILWYEEENLLKEYQKELDGEIVSNTMVYHTSRPYFLEFVHRKASKAIAIEQLCQAFQIKREETIAVGDSYNDISMIEYAAVGVAMENAPDEIKEKADFITRDCDHEGVSHVIERFILRED